MSNVPKYFQGNSVRGEVRASTARNFREIVDFLRVCPTLGMTRKAFLSLPKGERNEVKQVPFLVPATFTNSPCRRTHANAVHCNLIFIDLDELPDGKCPAAPFTGKPESLHQALRGFNFAAHLTASSTPEKPRMRIIVEAAAIPLDGYANAVDTAAAMLGLTSVTRESKVAVQPMFLPTLFSDSTDEDHPVIAYHLEGRAFTPEDISANGEKPQNAPVNVPEDAGPDALFFLKGPVPEITLEVAKEALSHISPDCPYHEWLECAAALRHQFSPHEAEEAYTLFDEWSSSGTKYGGHEDTRAKWNSLRPSPPGRMPVTIRTLLKHAVTSGWDDKRVKEDSFNVIVRWMENVSTVTELMEQGARKIMAAPLLSNVQEDMLVNVLCKQAGKRFSLSVSSTAVRKDIARIRAEMKLQAKPPGDNKEPVWVKGVCFISTTQEFFRHRTGEKYKTESFNSTYSRWLLPTEDQLKESGLPVNPSTLSRPIVSPHDYALNHLKIPAVYDYAYDPSQPNDMFFVNNGRKYVNTYTPTYPAPDPRNAEKAGELYQNHLNNLIAEREHRVTLTDFMAYMVQCPGRKIRWAVLIQSAEGAGKTFLAEVMKSVLGREHVKTISGEAISKGWNEWSFGSQLVVLEEVRVAGTNRFEIMNALKPLITNDDISINERNRNTRQVGNISNYMLFSNHHDALTLTPGDRRYFVVKSPLQTKSQIISLGEGYFPSLFGMLRDHPGAMRAWLAEWSISPGFHPDGHAPRTKYVEDLINDSAGDLIAAVRRLLLEGDHPLLQYDIVSSSVLLDTLSLEERMPRLSHQSIGHALREEGFQQVGRHRIGEERHYLWVRRGVKEDTAVDVAAQRLKDNSVNLGMEILF